MTPELQQTLDTLRECRAELVWMTEVVRERNPALITGDNMRRIVLATKFAEYVLALHSGRKEKAA
jgi:hypothetical protein